MGFAGIKSQWMKLQMLASNLPEKVTEQVKPLLKNQTTTCYKDCKKELIKLLAPKDDDIFDKATGLLLTTTPSALAKQLSAQHAPMLHPCRGAAVRDCLVACGAGDSDL